MSRISPAGGSDPIGFTADSDKATIHTIDESLPDADTYYEIVSISGEATLYGGALHASDANQQIGQRVTIDGKVVLDVTQDLTYGAAQSIPAASADSSLKVEARTIGSHDFSGWVFTS